MSSLRPVRDDEERLSVAPEFQRSASSSRLLVFPESDAARRADKLARLEAYDCRAAVVLEAIMDDLLRDAG
jgi:hypothetical protein